MSVWRACSLVFLGFAFSACATGVADDQPCEGDLDCPQGFLCSPDSKVCTIIPLPNNQNNQNNVNNVNNQNNMNNVNNQDDMGSDSGGGDPDMGPDAEVMCTPTCPANQACDNGMCVDACNPACTAPEICTLNGCAMPNCAATGQMCDLNTRDQGNFWCLQNDNQEGECFDKCDEPLAASTCGVGRYCLTLDAQAQEYVCIDSECDVQADCTASTCLKFDNNVGLCFPSGATPLGGTCDPAANSCEPGTYCRRLFVNSNSGVCSAVCDPWNATQCGGQECMLFTNRSGLCTNELDPQGSEPFFVCQTPGLTCTDATQCWNLGAQNGCLQYCRPGMNDCVGLDTGGPDLPICDNYVFPGDRVVGLCLPECDPLDQDPCGAGANCVNNICRTICTAGTVVADCCGGSTPCDFQCVNNFCE